MGRFSYLRRDQKIASERRMRNTTPQYSKEEGETIAAALHEQTHKAVPLPSRPIGYPELLFGPPKALAITTMNFGEYDDPFALQIGAVSGRYYQDDPAVAGRVADSDILLLVNAHEKGPYRYLLRMKVAHGKVLTGSLRVGPSKKTVLDNEDDVYGLTKAHLPQLLSADEQRPALVTFKDDEIGQAVLSLVRTRYREMLKQVPTAVLGSLGIDFTEKDYDSLQSQLAQFFPNADPQGLEAVVASLNTGFDRLRKTTDQTLTGTVLDFVVDGKRVYGKISPDKQRLRKEAAYHEDAWEHPALRVITPKLAGLVETADMAGLFTYGTENEGIVAKEDIKAYMKMRKDAFKAYAQMAGRDVREMASNPLMTDVFNRALSHASLWNRRGQGVYNAEKKPAVLPFEQIIEQAHPTNGALKTLRGVEQKYRTAECALAEAGALLPITLLHRDAREENIFPTYLNPNPRPTGDFGNVQPGEPMFDLSRIEVDPRNGSVVDAASYVRPYLFFRQFIEGEPLCQYQDTPTLERMTRLASFTDAVRTLGTKIPRSDAPATRYYARLAEGKAAMVR